MTPVLDVALARKVTELVNCGLVSGVGVQEPGKMCVEAAVCFALGLPHGDDPPCVGAAVRAAKIALNDANGWLDNADRAKGMRRLAVAQLGSDQIDQARFAGMLAWLTIKRVLPRALRNAAKIHPIAEHQAALEASAKGCEESTTESAAESAASAARSAASAARSAASAAASAAWSAAWSAAASAARSAASAAASAAWSAAWSAAASAARSAASAAASAARSAESAARSAASAAESAELHHFADVILTALRECGCPGVALLDQMEREVEAQP
ncbi:hypothetical protein VT84_13780 [Gemmata sp. SH-PL17]|uniref:hypothetical protein n=1 Tax=Gemmata sp. SH-PL17 TaxID=1630693 RepID=UPI00078BEE18|nr:hypothetical protein [Gemmata sp. SH-PL17]AMV25463.1 hypothetical protein VT84_13780 [Gemmata sp. SH-PL17]